MGNFFTKLEGAFPPSSTEQGGRIHQNSKSTNGTKPMKTQKRRNSTLNSILEVDEPNDYSISHNSPQDDEDAASTGSTSSTILCLSFDDDASSSSSPSSTTNRRRNRFWRSDL